MDSRERERNAAARAQALATKARAAVAALPYSDDRRKNPPVTVVARVPPAIPQDPPRADSVARIATRQRSFPPRREPSRGARSEFVFILIILVSCGLILSGNGLLTIGLLRWHTGERDLDLLLLDRIVTRETIHI